MAYTEKLPSGRYCGVYRDAAGRKRSQAGFTHKVATRRWAEQQEDDVAHGTHRDPRLAKKKLADWAGHWQDARVTEETTAAREQGRLKRVLEEFGDWPLSAITTIAVQAG